MNHLSQKFKLLYKDTWMILYFNNKKIIYLCIISSLKISEFNNKLLKIPTHNKMRFIDNIKDLFYSISKFILCFLLCSSSKQTMPVRSRVSWEKTRRRRATRDPPYSSTGSINTVQIRESILHGKLYPFNKHQIQPRIWYSDISLQTHTKSTKLYDK